MQKNSVLRLWSLGVLALGSLVFITAELDAANTRAENETVMTVAGEICGGCVKRIEAKLTPLPGIVEVRCDIPTKSVTVVPKPGTVLSPRALWTAMDEIGKTPSRLAGPNGTFTKLPKS